MDRIFRNGQFIFRLDLEHIGFQRAVLAVEVAGLGVIRRTSLFTELMARPVRVVAEAAEVDILPTVRQVEMAAVVW